MNKLYEGIVKLLNEKVKEYKTSSFVLHDPISIPHLFQNNLDIEIAGFLTALISWGSRKNSIQSARQLMKWMQDKPYYFVMNYSKSDDNILKKFYYRTFQPEDIIFFIRSLHHFYSNYHSLEHLFEGKTILEGIADLREELLKIPHNKRSEKHLPDIKKGSAAKRINMYLRWMVRKDEIDFGIWKNIKTSELLIPLDIHTARAAYYLGILKDKKSNLKNTIYLTEILKGLDNNDPVKYDFALFSISAKEINK